MRSFHTIDKNKIKKKAVLLLISDDFKNLHNAIVRQQHAINIIVNIIYKNFFFDTCLIFFSIDYRFSDDNKVFDVNAFDMRQIKLMFNVQLIKREFTNLNWITIAKIIYRKYQFRSILSIQISVFNNNIHYAEKRLIKSFDNFILFEVFKDNRFSRYILICAMIIEVIIFVLLIVISAKITDFKIAPLIASLITLEDEKNLIFLFNDFHFRALISIIKENNKIFIVIMITRCYEIINVKMNQIQRFLFKTNVNFIRCLICLFDNA